MTSHNDSHFMMPGFNAQAALVKGSNHNRWIVNVSYISEENVTMHALANPVTEGMICQCWRDAQWCLRYWCYRVPMIQGGGYRCNYDHWHFAGKCPYPQ